MLKKTAIFFVLLLCACATDAHAGIGAPVRAFKTGRFAVSEGFTLQGSYRITDDPLYEGKYAYNFFTADNRSRIQLIADKKGAEVVFEYLFYPPADDPVAAGKDGSAAISFVAQASRNAIAPEEFIPLVAEANMGLANIRHTKSINGYTVSMTRHDTDILKGWSIGVGK